jgi:enoyl-CoA hydratase
LANNATPARITVDLDGHVLLIGLNRPNKRNAFDLAMIDQFASAYTRLAEDREARVAVVFAHGDHFSAGLDLAEVGPVVAERGPEVLRGGSPYDPFGVWGEQVAKPVVLALGGIAFTLSIELALASDIVVAGEDVRFCQLEVGRGIVPFGGGTFRAPAQLGWGNAMRFLLTAEEFGAKEAYRIGLVQEVVPAGRQLARSVEIAKKIAEQAPLGVQATLETARAARAVAERAAAEQLRALMPQILSSEDATEGLRSFLERRKGEFTGD